MGYHQKGIYTLSMGTVLVNTLYSVAIVLILDIAFMHYYVD